jgi:cytochrome c oxidase cbb3-type subunit 3
MRPDAIAPAPPRRAASWAAAALCTALAAGCEREQRRFEVPPHVVAASPQGDSGLRVGPAASTASMPTPDPPSAAAPVAVPHWKPGDPDAGNAYAVSQGKRLFRWYNCSGCHGNGGGNIGPPLMDEKWIYGAAPNQIADTIVRGRPNGMPAFAGRIPDDQLWQIVAYVRSMSGQLRKDVAPARNDSLAPGAPESDRDQEQPRIVTPH